MNSIFKPGRSSSWFPVSRDVHLNLIEKFGWFSLNSSFYFPRREKWFISKLSDKQDNIHVTHADICIPFLTQIIYDIKHVSLQQQQQQQLQPPLI